jgi:protein ImuA
MSSLARLRAQISALEGFSSRTAGDPAQAAAFGVAAIDDCLPWGGLPAGGLHEIRPENTELVGAAIGFAAFCLGRQAIERAGPLLWLSLTDELYPPGLAACGLPTDRLLLVRPPQTAKLLWSLEESLRCKPVAGVVAEIYGLDFKAARRLSLAARGSGVPALLLNRGPPLDSSLTRWQVAAATSPSVVGTGEMRWRLRLTRCRFMAIGDAEQAPSWLVEGRDAAGGFSLVAVSGDRSLAQIKRRRAG